MDSISALVILFQPMEPLYRQLSDAKTQALTFAKPRKLKRKQAIIINGISARHVLYSNLLDLTVNQQQNWFAHINN